MTRKMFHYCSLSFHFHFLAVLQFSHVVRSGGDKSIGHCPGMGTRMQFLLRSHWHIILSCTTNSIRATLCKFLQQSVFYKLISTLYLTDIHVAFQAFKLVETKIWKLDKSKYKGKLNARTGEPELDSRQQAYKQYLLICISVVSCLTGTILQNK